MTKKNSDRSEEGATTFESGRAESAVREAERRLLRHERFTVSLELAIIGGLTAAIYGFAVRFQWFEAFSDWVLANRGPEQMDEVVMSAIFLLIGLSVFGFRRWRGSEEKIISHERLRAAMQRLHADLDSHVSQRTAELREANATLRMQSAALNAAANAIVITDRDGAIVWTNPAFTALTGYTSAEAAGKNPRALVKSGRNTRAVYQKLWETILAGRVWQGELVNRRKDGSLYNEEQTITPVRDANGAITHFIAIKQDLTERKLVDQAVHTSRQQFQAVFEQAAVGMIVAEGSRGQFLSVNRRFCALVGYTAEELQHLALHDITHPDDIAEDTRQLEKISRGVIREFFREKRYRRKDGSFVWVRVFVALLDPTAAGSTRRIGVIEDISERKQAELALRQSEEHYRSLFDNMLNGYALCRMIFVDGRAEDFTYLLVNPAFETLTGLKDVVGRNASTIIPGLKENDPELLEAYGRVAMTGVPEQFENFVKALDMWFSISVYRPAPGHFVAIFDVITERKRTEAALRESEERYRLLFENNPLPMWLYDLESLRFLAVNESAVSHYGYTREELLAMTIEHFHPPEDLPTLRETFERTHGDAVRTGEWRHRRKDGMVMRVEITSRPLRFAGRDARLVLAADVTEKKLLEEKLLHVQRLESVGMLAAGIAHDLNNVLAPIVFAAPLLREHLTDARDVQILDTLEQSAARGTGLVKQILAFARKSSADFRIMQVKHLARDIVNVMEETFPKSIALEHQIAASPWPVHGDPTQIHQVILNLCVNARDAMLQGGTLHLAIYNLCLGQAEARAIPEARPGRWLVLEVADTGTGISPEILHHIWTPFFTTKGVDRGTGLGLSTVRGIAVSHHGFVELRTAVGRGSTFRVYLPAAEEESPRKTDQPSPDIPDGRGELILVVDDDKPIREIVANILGKHGYRVLRCEDGTAALADFVTRRDEIDLVITDVDMPNLGGLALSRALLNLRPDVRLIAMSGLSRNNTDGAEMPEIQKLAHAFLLKPFQAEQLLQAVQASLHPNGKN